MREPASLLHRLWAEGSDFAAWRLPNESNIRLLHSAPTYTYNNIDALNGRRGFAIFPFAPSHHPGVLLEGGQCASLETSAVEPEMSPCLHPGERPACEAPADYVERFEKMMLMLRRRHLHKIVLSHSFRYRRDNYPAADAFLLACRRHPQAYAYLCRTQASGSWLGCTPEILLAGEGGNWRTMALAGTAANAQSLSSAKNSEEQKLVADYIRRRLSSLGIEVTEDGPKAMAVDSGLMHLCTDFSFILPDSQSSGSILQALHPTPAVSGMPPTEAQAAILLSENHDRAYYTGFVGMLDPDGCTNVYVNLRCMQIDPKAVTLYAGSGLMPASDPTGEWQELTDKLQTMLSII